MIEIIADPMTTSLQSLKDQGAPFDPAEIPIQISAARWSCELSAVWVSTPCAS